MYCSNILIDIVGLIHLYKKACIQGQFSSQIFVESNLLLSIDQSSLRNRAKLSINNLDYHSFQQTYCLKYRRN
jgi:hypothetical protein